MFHVCTPEQWAIWEDQDRYEAAGLSEEGFIHCCTEQQLNGVLERYFSGIDQVFLLHLDTEKIEAALKWEPAVGGELFPHIYGPINKSAVLGIESLTRSIDIGP
jgi:uncharacterized protein (DUF952 family)